MARAYAHALLQMHLQPAAQEGVAALGAAQLQEALLRQIGSHCLSPLPVHVHLTVPAQRNTSHPSDAWFWAGASIRTGDE